MERVCQSVQYNVSSDNVRAKGWVRVPSTTVSLQDEMKAYYLCLLMSLKTHFEMLIQGINE